MGKGLRIKDTVHICGSFDVGDFKVTQVPEIHSQDTTLSTVAVLRSV